MYFIEFIVNHLVDHPEDVMGRVAERLPGRQKDGLEIRAPGKSGSNAKVVVGAVKILITVQNHVVAAGGPSSIVQKLPLKKFRNIAKPAAIECVQKKKYSDKLANLNLVMRSRSKNIARNKIPIRQRKLVQVIQVTIVGTPLSIILTGQTHRNTATHVRTSNLRKNVQLPVVTEQLSIS